jgi:hypothetical protein
MIVVRSGGLVLLTAPTLNARPVDPARLPVPWGATVSVLERQIFPQTLAGNVSDNQIWYKVQGGSANIPISWIVVRYDGLSYLAGNNADPCNNLVSVPTTLTFHYDRRAAANYAIEHSYDTAVNHAFLQNTEQRVTQALQRTPPLPYAYFRYFALGKINPADGQPITGSATFVSESQWMGGMPMTWGDSDPCNSPTSVTEAGWRYCFHQPTATPPIGRSTNPYDTHGDLHTYWQGNTGILQAPSIGRVFSISGGQVPLAIVGRSSLGTTNPTRLRTDLNPTGPSQLIDLGDGIVSDRPALSARVLSLLNQSQNGSLKMGDYITMLRRDSGITTATPFHGLMVIGWQEALDCRDAIFQGASYQNAFRIWTVNQFAEIYVSGGTISLGGTAIANPVPWVVDFTAPPVYNNGILETQNPVPRPFYCTMYFDFERGFPGQIQGVDRFYEHDWQIFSLPDQVVVSTQLNAPNRLYVDSNWGW